MTRSYRGDTQKQTSRQSNVGVAQNSGRMESVAFFLFFLQQTLLASLLCKLAAKFYSYTLKSSPMILASLPKIRRFSQIKLLLMPRCPCRISPCVVYIFNIYIYRYEQKRRDFFFLFCFFAKTSRRFAESPESQSRQIVLSAQLYSRSGFAVLKSASRRRRATCPRPDLRPF